MFGRTKKPTIEQLEKRIEALVEIVKRMELREQSFGAVVARHDAAIGEIEDRVGGLEKREEAILFPVPKA